MERDDLLEMKVKHRHRQLEACVHRQLVLLDLQVECSRTWVSRM